MKDFINPIVRHPVRRDKADMHRRHARIRPVAAILVGTGFDVFTGTTRQLRMSMSFPGAKGSTSDWNAG
jgi:hypothetical protein